MSDTALSERVSVMETVMTALAEDVRETNQDVRETNKALHSYAESTAESIKDLGERILIAQKPQWSVIIGFAALVLTVVGYFVADSNESRHDLQDQINNLQTQVTELRVTSATDSD